MAKWWKLGLGKDKDQGPASEPTPAPSPEPTPSEGAGRKKRGGLLGRLLGRGKKQEETPAPAPEPSAPTAPSPPSAPSAPAEAEGPGESPLEEGEEGEGGDESPEREYPSFLHVEAEGDWVISDTEWTGTMSGTLHGTDVQVFIDAMEGKGGPDYHTAIPLIADAYGIPGGLIDISRSTIRSVNY